MYTGLSRKNKYFTPEMTDELNASLKEVDVRIEEHVATPLKPKLKVTPVHNKWNGNSTDRSCRIGYMFVLDATVDISDIEANVRTEIGSINAAITYPVISTCYGREKPYRFIIENGKAYIVSNTDVEADTIDIYEPLVVLV